ncbi:MAG TPA: CPBP family intramembrane glutamic endopeptidase [Pyrinomonadaceae bacterium]
MSVDADLTRPADADDPVATGEAGERLLALWEIASVTLSFLAAAWVAAPFAENNSKLVGAVPVVFALVLIWLSHRARGETARAVGWRADNFGRALRLLALPMLGAAVVVVLVGWTYRSFRVSKLENWQWVLWLFAWGLIQQYALHGFVNRRAQLVWGRGWRSVLAVAAVFALLHLPNPWLALATFAGGVAWAAVYQRAPNIPALAVSHALMSLLLVWALPPWVMKSLRVGFKYFN